MAHHANTSRRTVCGPPVIGRLPSTSASDYKIVLSGQNRPLSGPNAMPNGQANLYKARSVNDLPAIWTRAIRRPTAYATRIASTTPSQTAQRIGSL